MAESGWFAGNHGPEGDFRTLKGRMLEPHICQPMQSTSHTAIRNAPSPHGTWTSSVIVNTGMTGGGGQMANK